MDHDPDFTIPIHGLSLGSHRYDWVLDRSIYNRHGESEIESAQLSVQAILDRSMTHIDVHIELEGTARSACAVCLSPIPIEIQSMYDTVVRYGNGEDEECIYIPREASRLDLSTAIYEAAQLALPIIWRREDCEDEEMCDESMLEHLSSDDEITEEDSGPSVWDQLREKLNE